MTTTESGIPVMLSDKQVEAELGLPPGALKRDRSLGQGLPFVRLTDRRIRYKASDIAAYIAANTVTPELKRQAAQKDSTR